MLATLLLFVILMGGSIGDSQFFTSTGSGTYRIVHDDKASSSVFQSTGQAVLKETSLMTPAIPQRITSQVTSSSVPSTQDVFLALSPPHTQKLLAATYISNPEIGELKQESSNRFLVYGLPIIS